MREIVKLFISFIWGFAEATLFFIVPDVILSRYALDDLKLAFKAILFSLSGALIGGYLMYEFGKRYPIDAELLLANIPSIEPHLIEKARTDFKACGLWSLFVGAILGRPYKIYAVLCGQAEISLIKFFFASICARTLRFAVVVLGIKAIGSQILDYKLRLKIFYLSWIGFYLFYFSLNN